MHKTFAILLTLFLTACATPPQLPIKPIQLDFATLAPIYLNTSDMRIIDRSQLTPQHEPYIGHLFTPTVNQALHKLIAQRLHASGQLGHATFIIKDANVVAQRIEKEPSMFTRQQAWKYIGRLEVSLEAQSPLDGSRGLAKAVALHTVTLPEEPTAYEKQEAYRKLITALMDRLNENLDKGIKKHLSSFLVDKRPTAPQIPLKLAPTTDSALPDVPEMIGE